VTSSFGWAAVIYAGMILLVTPWSRPFQPIASQCSVASRKLIHNHRIVSGDLRLPRTFSGSLGFYVADRTKLEGQYVARDVICRGNPVGTDDLSSVPDLKPPQGKRLMTMPLSNQQELASLLDAQTAVSLAGQTNDVKQPIVSISATVHAIICTKDDSGKVTCSAILALGSDADQAAVGKYRESLRILIGP
jgi:hypothetical protein